MYYGVDNGYTKILHQILHYKKKYSLKKWFVILNSEIYFTFIINKQYLEDKERSKKNIKKIVGR